VRRNGHWRALAAALLLIVSAEALAAQGAPAGSVPAMRLGFAVGRLARIDSAFERAVRRGEIAGAVVLVMRDGQTAYERAFGWADREAGRHMRPDAVFRIASESKAVTSVAVMSLVEEGKVGLDDPVARFIPAFAHTTVALRTDSGASVVPARRPITIHDLLTHTAGISYGTDSALGPLYATKGLGPAAGFGWYTADKAEPICETVERLATLPFAAQPGKRFVYGYNTDILGCVIERAGGMPFDAFLAKRITGPLDMRDTHFFLPAGDRDRLAVVYASTGDSAVVRAPDGPRGQGDYVEGPRRSFSGGAGLLSTARDYARFLEMLRNGGSLDGVRVLAPKTVALMTTNQTDTLYSMTGEGFGLGFRVLQRAGADGRVESVGSFGWTGAYGTIYEVDPTEHLVLVFMIQQLPNRSSIGASLPMLVYQALVPVHQ
jgi:CubicO group peptidase (beta-lactamase class C family)